MLSLGGIITILLVVSVIPIWSKVKEHSRKIDELEKVAGKPAVKQ